MASQDKRRVVCIQTDQNMYHFFTNGSHISIRLIIASNNNKSKLNHLLASESVWKLSLMTQPPVFFLSVRKTSSAHFKCALSYWAVWSKLRQQLMHKTVPWDVTCRCGSAAAEMRTLFLIFFYFHYMLTPHSLPPFPSVTLHWQQDLELSSVIPIVCPHRQKKVTHVVTKILMVGLLDKDG